MGQRLTGRSDHDQGVLPTVSIIAFSHANHGKTVAKIQPFGRDIAGAHFQIPLVHACFIGMLQDMAQKTRGQSPAAQPGIEVFVYPDAGHGFACEERASFSAPNASVAAERTRIFLDKALPA